MKTLFAVFIVLFMASCDTGGQDARIEVTDTLNVGDTASVMLDSLSDSITVMREKAKEKASGQR